MCDGKGRVEEVLHRGNIEPTVHSYVQASIICSVMIISDERTESVPAIPGKPLRWEITREAAARLA